MGPADTVKSLGRPWPASAGRRLLLVYENVLPYSNCSVKVSAHGAMGDRLLVVDGNPLKDLGVFQDQGAHIRVVMQGGRFHRNHLGAG